MKRAHESDDESEMKTEPEMKTELDLKIELLELLVQGKKTYNSLLDNTFITIKLYDGTVEREPLGSNQLRPMIDWYEKNLDGLLSRIYNTQMGYALTHPKKFLEYIQPALENARKYIDLFPSYNLVGYRGYNPVPGRDLKPILVVNLVINLEFLKGTLIEILSIKPPIQNKITINQKIVTSVLDVL